MSAYQGNYAAIKAEVVKKLRLETAEDGDAVGAWVNLAYQQAVQETGCLQQTATATLTEGDADYTLPATVAWIRELTITYPDGSVSEPLDQVTEEEIAHRRRITPAEGQNVLLPVYAVAGQNLLQLWPTPGAGQTMNFLYVYLPEQLVEDDDEPLIMEPYGSKLLEYGALVEGARFKKDVLLMSDYEQQYGVWLAKFQTWLNRREGSSGSRFRVRGVRRPLVFADRSTDTGN